MFGYQKVVIADFERGLKFVDRRLVDVLEPGVYRFVEPFGPRTHVEVHDVSSGVLNVFRGDYLVRNAPAAVGEHVEVVTMGATELGLVRTAGQLVRILRPGGTVILWRRAAMTSVERVDVGAELAVPRLLAEEIARAELTAAEKRTVMSCTVSDHAVGLLIVDGAFDRRLEPGVHTFWSVDRSVLVEVEDLRTKTLEVGGQDMLTRDKVSLRVNLGASFRVVDVLRARAVHADLKAHLYRQLQLALRRAVGARTLDDLLNDKQALDGEIGAAIAEEATALGVAFVTVGVRDLILPGDMKDILNRVVEAGKEAEANVIRRRDETASTRSLLNSARLMDEHPTLLRLKELEALEKVTERIDRITVFGGLDGVLNDLVKIAAPR